MAKKSKDIKYYEATGRRKEAIARVRLYIPGKDKTVTVESAKLKQGEVYINKKILSEYFPSLSEQGLVLKPLKLTNNLDRFVISVHVMGGGKNGQLGAIIHGISRAINNIDKDQYRGILKEEGLLTRDPRTRERRKVGRGGKARRRKQSPKR